MKMIKNSFKPQTLLGNKYCLVFFLILGLLPVAAWAYIPVSGPMVIENPGEYRLMENITNYNGDQWQNGTEFYQPCIEILASDVIFDGNGHSISTGTNFNISRNDQTGIYIDNQLERVSVINTVVNGFNYGIYYYKVNPSIQDDSGGRIESNRVTNNDVGITLLDSNFMRVSNNDASNNKNVGIQVLSGYNNTVTVNAANFNLHGGIYTVLSDNNRISGNEANNNVDFGIYLILPHRNVVSWNYANNNINTSAEEGSILVEGSGIILNGGDQNHLFNNTANANHLDGIEVLPPEYGVMGENWIENNTANQNGHTVSQMTNAGDGVFVFSDDGSTHVNNNIVYGNFNSGIHLLLSADSNLNGNHAENNIVHGIWLDGTKTSILLANEILGNKYGIELSTKLNGINLVSSDRNTVIQNHVHDNTESGVYLNGTDNFLPIVNNSIIGNDIYNNPKLGIGLKNSNNNIFNGNLIHGNKLGIKIDSSMYNNIYNNVFNNTDNFVFGSQINPNTWSVLLEPGTNIVGGPYKGGNFWAKPDGTGFSQYTPEGNTPGICNEQYSITGPDNIDIFPLTNYLKVSFTADKTSGNAPLTVTFSGTVAGQTGNQWLWNFGDGSTDTIQNPTHVYQSNGTYNVSLTAYNGGWSNTTLKAGFISVGIAPPVPDFTGSPVTGTFPLTVFFSDQSTPNSGPYAVNAWDWDFGDNSTHSSLQNPTHVYQTTGTYNVILSITSPGWTSQKIKTAYITPGGTPFPTAAFTMDRNSGPIPLDVKFIDQSTGSQPLSYTWDFGDGSNSSEQNPAHKYEISRTYHVNLTVSNAGGISAPVTHDVVAGGPSEPIVAFTAIPRSGTVPLIVSFLDQSTANPDTSTYAWNFGDGATSNQRNPAHQYVTSGSYDVTLTVTANGMTYPLTEAAFVVVNAPGTVIADFNFNATPSNGIEPVVVQFYDRSSGAPAPTSWFWDFDDQYAPTSEKTSTLQSPVHNYIKAGNYTPKLTASNSQGPNTKVYPGVIYVRHTTPVAAFNATPTTGYNPFSVTFTDQSIGQALNAWDWNFGDGGTSQTQSPVYTFNTPGTYSVTFKSYNDGGWSAPITKPNLITVLASPPSPPANIIKLYPGWNLVSTPKKLAAGSDTVDVVFANVDFDHHSPLLYDGQTKTWIQFISGTVKPLDGVWVYSKYQIDVTLQFDTTSIPLPPSKLVYRGWNAVGETGVNPISARELLTQVGQLDANWDTLIGINASTHVAETYIRGSINPDYSDLKFTFPTKGYWLQMNTDDTLMGLV